LTQAERDLREEFAVEACHLMRERLIPSEVWEPVGLPKQECQAIAQASPAMQLFRARLFSRIVPTIKDIGLWGPKIRKAFEDMGVMEFAKTDAVALLETDNRVAAEFDARRAAAAG